jgi:heme a synthase
MRAAMQATRRRQELLHRIAWLTLLLLLAVTCLSAYLRHSAAGLGCAPWPACFGQGERMVAGAVVVSGQALTPARTAHRAVATLALLLIVAMLVLSFSRQPRLRREAALSAWLLLLALLLALLGVVTPGSRLPIVALGNLLGGFAMFAIALRWVFAPRPRARALVWAARGAALLLLLHIASGALVSAAQAGLACTDIRECFEQSSAAGWDWRALSPWREPDIAVGTPHSEGALMQLLHRVAALLVAPAVAAFAIFAHRRGHARDALALALLLAFSVALGLAAGSTGLPLATVLLHNLAAALLLALLLRLA